MPFTTASWKLTPLISRTVLRELFFTALGVRAMFRDRRIPWLPLIAAAALALYVVVAFRGGDWVHDRVNRLIMWPLTEVLRFAW
jgi:hypothetical protein